MSEQAGLHISSTDGEILDLLGMPSRIIVPSAETDGAWFLFEQTVPPGQGVPPHVHSREDEIFFIEEGSVSFLVGEEKVSAVAGDVIHAPRDIPHGYEATGDSPAKIRFMVFPGKLEAMFVEMSEWPSGEEPDLAKLGKLCSRYGIQFLKT